MKILYIPLLLVIASLYWSCSTGIVDGGNTSDIGNAIAGTIIDENETPIDSAEFRLRTLKDSGYSIGIDTIVHTNAKGEYRFNLPPIGLYFITATKNNRPIAYIDSVEVKDTQTVIIPIYRISELSSVKGVVVLSDTSGVREKGIEIFCEPLDYKIKVVHGDTFFITDIPRGRYPLVFTPDSDLFRNTRTGFSVGSGEIKDLGTITLLPQGYFTEEELCDLAESMARAAGKDVRDVLRILRE